MPWSSAAKLGPHRNPGRQTLAANGARTGTARTRFPSQSGSGTRSTTSETGSHLQTPPSSCSSDTDRQLTPMFLFRTLDIGGPDVDRTLVHKPSLQYPPAGGRTQWFHDR